MATDDERRAELNAWIVKTRRTQKQLSAGLVIAAIVAIALFFASKTAGAFAVFIVATVGICGFWITSAHIVDWKNRIDEIGKPRPVGRAGKKR